MSAHDHVVRRWSCLIVGLTLLLGVAPAIASEPDAAVAPAPAKVKKQYRWGAGWDEGLALRARLGDGWGLGLRVNPDLVDPESSGSDSSDNSWDWLCSSGTYCAGGSRSHSSENADKEARTFSASLMAYREKKLGKWLAVGPYLALNYDRRRETETQTRESESQQPPPVPYRTDPAYSSHSRTTLRSWRRTIGIELGVRPTFQFHERLLLETRFGLEWAHTKWNESAETHSENDGGGVVYPVGAEVPGAPSSTDVASPRGANDSQSERHGTETRLHTVGERLGPGAELRFVVLF